MTQDFNLAKVFADLANDPGWPWRVEHRAGIFLTMARLALMVVDKQHIIWDYRDRHGRVGRHKGMDHQTVMLDLALKEYDINPDHYAKVKKRVEETEG